MDIYNEKILPLFRNSGLNDRELEKQIGLPRGKIYDWNSGRSKSYKQYVDKIAGYFGVSTDYILGKDTYGNPGKQVMEVAKLLGDDYSVQVIDKEHCIYRDLFTGYDIEISGLDNSRKNMKAVLFVWKYKRYNGRKTPQYTVEMIENIRSVDELKEKLRFVIEKYGQNKGPSIPISEDINNTSTNLNDNSKWLEENASPLGTIVYLPVLGRVAAGNGVIAHDEIIGHEFVSADKICSGETYFWLHVKGDSMSPKIEDGDLVLIKKQSSVDSGSYAVVIVDGEDGVVKKVNYGPDWIELVSTNPYYPARRFEGSDVLRITVIGKVIEVRRVL